MYTNVMYGESHSSDQETEQVKMLQQGEFYKMMKHDLPSGMAA